MTIRIAYGQRGQAVPCGRWPVYKGASRGVGALLSTPPPHTHTQTMHACMYMSGGGGGIGGSTVVLRGLRRPVRLKAWWPAGCLHTGRCRCLLGGLPVTRLRWCVLQLPLLASLPPRRPRIWL